MSEDAAPALENTRTNKLVTFRRSGAETATPVWFAVRSEKLYVGTEENSGKVKRIRANANVRYIACNSRGTVDFGDWNFGTVRFVEETDLRDGVLR